MSTDILGFHSSGKWSQTTDPAFADNVRRMRKDGRTFGTRTEATAAAFDHEINWPGDGWGHWHPRDLGRDCSVEWHNPTWDLLDRGVAPLTGIQIRTEKGHLQPPVALTWVLLRHEESREELELGAFHLDLASNDRRIAANLDECHNLRARALSHRERHPKRRILWQGDGNRDQHDQTWRAYFRREVTRGTGLRSGWRHPLPTAGTHGDHLLDLAWANFPIRSRILPDDPSSDHRPFETAGRL